jgi:DNA-binding transcriptional regulator YiaG
MHSAGMPTNAEVRAARELLGESQGEFGKRFGVDQTTVHRWEKHGLPERGTARVAVSQFLEELRKPAEAAA